MINSLMDSVPTDSLSKKNIRLISNLYIDEGFSDSNG